MYRARQRNYPPVPDNLDELAAIIRNNMERFGKIHGEPFFNNVLGDGKILLFVIPQLIHLGVNSAELHLDGTFKCIPRKPKARQLFILMSVYKDHVSSNFMAFVFLTEEKKKNLFRFKAFPISFALMTDKALPSYQTLLDYQKINFNVSSRRFMSDYEQAIHSAVQAVFPEAVHLGCWFHYGQVSQFIRSVVNFYKYIASFRPLSGMFSD